MHVHFVHYARYRLLTTDGKEMGVGRKQAFCLLDLEPYSLDATDPPVRYSCDDQGIHRGWADVYDAGLDCQWLDVTDVPDGDYQLEVHVNPEQILPEKDYDNNVTVVPVHITTPTQVTDPLAECMAEEIGPDRDCGWDISFSSFCNPGETVTVGCNSAAGCGLGSCTGEPVLRVCPGASVCGDRQALVSTGEGCTSDTGSCPFTDFMCPATGQYTVLTGANIPGDRGVTCDVGVR
jgi:hypothetical protein